MKLGACFVAVALAGRADKRGKSGRKDVSNERYIWQTPRCMAAPGLCDETCNLEFNNGFGNITIGADDYTARRSCLWTIDIPADRELSLQFVNDFDLEWHHKCAYDKVHIFDGLDNARLGRFCGPKQNGQHDYKPFDGARKNKPDWMGRLAFWDKPYETQSHKVIIAFDADQSNNDFNGFTLKWTSKRIEDINFKSVEYSLNYIRRNLIKRVMNEEFAGNGASVLKRAINTIIRNANKAIYDPDRPRSCTKDKSEDISDDLFDELVAFHNREGVARNFRNYSEFISKLTLDYIGNCRNSAQWSGRVAGLIRKWDRQMSLANN